MKQENFQQTCIYLLKEEVNVFRTLRNQLKDLNQYIVWSRQCKEALSNPEENGNLIEQLVDKNISVLIEKVSDGNEFNEKDVLKLLVESKKLTNILLHTISQSDIKLKSYKFDLHHIENLVKEANRIKMPDEIQDSVRIYFIGF